VSARVVLLATSARTAPGLLSWEAWSTLRSADSVLVGADDHPLLPALAAADVPVDVLAYDDVDALADHLLSRDGRTLWIASPDGDPGLAEVLGRRLDAGSDVEVDVVLGSWDLPGAHLLDLVAVMDRLRSPGGCPWDAEQTHESLVEYLVEEAYETVEAIETGDDPALREELGDVLLQVAFHARIAQEHEQPWGIDDVADGIVRKLVSRHPHVFADHDARTPDEVEASWKRLKAAEKQRESVTDGIPLALPSLVLAAKLLRRSADVELPAEAWVAPEVEAAADRAWEASDGEIGDLLLALAARAHAAGVDLESELRDALRRHRSAVRAAEGLPS
jgi:XTP/dITP diphosphohydrolase